MYRVYLDWNVIAGFKNTTDNSDDAILKEILYKNQSNIIVPYSPAHIQDLQKGWENPENHNLIKNDLDLLDEISNLNCMQYDYLKNHVNPTIGSASILFNQFEKIINEFPLNPDILEKLFLDTPFPTLGKLMTLEWKNTSTDIDFQKLEDSPDSRVFYETYFKRTKKLDNVYNFMVDYSEFYTDLNKKPELYKNMVKVFRESTGIEPKRISNLEEPLIELNEILLKSNKGLGFDMFSRLESNDDNILKENLLLKFSTEYMGLDMSGYHPDSFSKKNLFSNFTNDSHHAFYAGNCDYFVSKEKKLLKKARVLYGKYNIETKPMLPSEFIDEISNNINDTFNARYLERTIDEVLENGYIEEIKDHNFQDSRIFLYRPEIPIMAYFNLLYLKFDMNEKATIVLCHKLRKFYTFTFYAEMKAIVNKCFSIFGNDIHNKSMFNDNDKEMINKDNWDGRAWWSKSYLIHLTYNNQTTGLQLTLEQV